MSAFFLLNNVTLGTTRFLAGMLVDDVQDATQVANLRAAGGVLWPSNDAAVAAAASAAQLLKARAGGVDESMLSDLMIAAASGGTNIQTLGPLALVAGTLTVNTGITITAKSRVVPILNTPGAGVSGTRYAITGLVVGGPGTGAFTVTAKDSAAGDNTVATDVSLLDFVIVG